MPDKSEGREALSLMSGKECQRGPSICDRSGSWHLQLEHCSVQENAFGSRWWMDVVCRLGRDARLSTRTSSRATRNPIQARRPGRVHSVDVAMSH